MTKKASARAKRSPLFMSSSAQPARTGDTDEGAAISVVTHGSSGNRSSSSRPVPHQQNDVTASASSRRSSSPLAADRKNNANASTDDSVREELETLERDMIEGLGRQLLSERHSVNDIQKLSLNNLMYKGSYQRAIEGMQRRVQRSLAQWVLHPVIFKDSTDSATNRSKVSRPAMKFRQPLVPRTIDAENEFWMECAKHPTLRNGTFRPIKDIHSESQMLHIMVTLFEDLITALGKDDMIEVLSNRIVGGVECDILLVNNSNKKPMAAVEIKKPGFLGSTIIANANDPGYNFHGEDERDIFSCKRDGPKAEYPTAGKVVGQNLDQLQAIEIGGVTNAYGMITNGRTVMITQNTRNGFILSEPMDGQMEQNSSSPASENIGLQVSNSSKRMLTTSHPISLSETPATFILMLIEFINRAYENFRNSAHTSEITAMRSVRQLLCKGPIQENTKRRKKTRNDDKLCFKKMKKIPLKSIKKWDFSNAVAFNEDVELYLFHMLGFGSIGDCCLAMTNGIASKKKFCVVKFFIGDFLVLNQFCQKEEENWTTCYPELIEYTYRGTACDGRPYFCMPYFQPIEKEERSAVLDDGSLKEALYRFANEGRIHKEANRWHHIGRFDGKIYILDLDHETITEEKDSKMREDWINKSLAELTESS